LIQGDHGNMQHNLAGSLSAIFVALTLSHVIADLEPCPLGCSCSFSPTTFVSCTRTNLSTIPSPLPVPTWYLDLSGNQLVGLTHSILTLATVARVNSANFSWNRIELIETGSFRRWSSLEGLDLSGNRLSSLDQGSFRGAAQSSMLNLNLSSNRLTEVDGAFSDMTSLSRSELFGYMFYSLM
jgi:hypothetical protein